MNKEQYQEIKRLIKDSLIQSSEPNEGVLKVAIDLYLAAEPNGDLYVGFSKLMQRIFSNINIDFNVAMFNSALVHVIQEKIIFVEIEKTQPLTTRLMQEMVAKHLVGFSRSKHAAVLALMADFAPVEELFSYFEQNPEAKALSSSTQHIIQNAYKSMDLQPEEWMDIKVLMKPLVMVIYRLFKEAQQRKQVPMDISAVAAATALKVAVLYLE